MASHLVFVYGTLQQGHRNASINRGQTMPGRYCTVSTWPLWVLGPAYLPWLSWEEGEGLRVWGELVAVDDAGLAAMDALEELDRPDWYMRKPVAVQWEGQGPVVLAQAYFGSPARVRYEPRHAGPLPAYTLAVAAQFAHLPGAQADALADAQRAGRNGVNTPRC